jgi:outer membrane protein assembly factor BamB
MRRAAVVIALVGAGVGLWTGIVRAQFGRGAGEYSTVGADAHRSSWVRTDARISPDSLSRPGFEMVWKVKLNNEARQLNALTPAALLNGYIGYRGFRSLALLGGSSNQVFAVDTDLGRLEWQQAIMATPGPQGASTSCPGGMTANVARPVSAAFPPPPMPGRGGGRGSAAKSGVGEPNEGAVPLKEYLARMAVPPPPPPAPIPPAAAPDAGRGSLGGRGPRPGLGPMKNFVHSISSDGMFHSMYVSNGEEPSPPVKFLPPNANGEGLIVVDNSAYAVTTDHCGGAPNAIWALDIESGEVATWQPASGGIAGSEGPAFGPDGTVYVTSQSGDLAILEPKTLKLKDVFKAGREFASSPTVFQFDNKIMIAAATLDGGIYVFDGAALSSVLVASGRFTGGALASWQDAAGSRYLLATTSTAVMSWKLIAQDGSLTLEKAWVSPEMVAPLTPLIVNGVVFAASSGEFVSDDAKITAARSVPAVVYALDGVTGKVLWNSGKAIASFVHGGGLSGGGSQVYLGTHDGTLYSFGFPIEH